MQGVLSPASSQNNLSQQSSRSKSKETNQPIVTLPIKSKQEVEIIEPYLDAEMVRVEVGNQPKRSYKEMRDREGGNFNTFGE